MREYRRVFTSQRRMTGLELIGCLIAILLFILAGFMIAMACWASFSPGMRTEAKITVGQAWTAALVSSVAFSGWVNMLLRHLSQQRY